MSYIQYLKQLPEYVEARAEMAAMYRAARKENPQVARLLFKRIRIATKAAIDSFWTADPNGADCGLARLLK